MERSPRYIVKCKQQVDTDLCVQYATICVIKKCVCVCARMRAMLVLGAQCQHPLATPPWAPEPLFFSSSTGVESSPCNTEDHQLSAEGAKY